MTEKSLYIEIPLLRGKLKIKREDVIYIEYNEIWKMIKIQVKNCINNDSIILKEDADIKNAEEIYNMF